MKKVKSINSNLVQYVASFLPKSAEIIDVFMQNNYLCVVTSTGYGRTSITIKIKQNG